MPYYTFTRNRQRLTSTPGWQSTPCETRRQAADEAVVKYELSKYERRRLLRDNYLSFVNFALYIRWSA